MLKLGWLQAWVAAVFPDVVGSTAAALFARHFSGCFPLTYGIPLLMARVRKDDIPLWRPGFIPSGHAGDSPLSEGSDTILLRTAEGAGEAPSGWRTIPLQLALFGCVVRFELHAADRRVPLRAIVPAARALDDAMVAAARCALKSVGADVRCGKGCAACCKYLIPLSVPEVHQLWRDVQDLPEPDRSRVKDRFARSAQRVLNSRMPELPPAAAGMDDRARRKELRIAGKWYTDLNIPCPLLVDNACIMYDRRPMACRQHMVTTNPRACSNVRRGGGATVRLPFSMTQVLSLLTALLQRTGPEMAILALAPTWCERNAARAEALYPAAELAGALADILGALAGASAEAA